MGKIFRALGIVLLVGALGALGYVVYEQHQTIDEQRASIEQISTALEDANAERVESDPTDAITLLFQVLHVQESGANAYESGRLADLEERLGDLEDLVGGEYVSPLFDGDVHQRLEDIELALSRAEDDLSQACSALLVAGIFSSC